MVSVRYTRNLFLRGMCIIYLAAFVSFYVQIPGELQTNMNASYTWARVSSWVYIYCNLYDELRGAGEIPNTRCGRRGIFSERAAPLDSVRSLASAFFSLGFSGSEAAAAAASIVTLPRVAVYLGYQARCTPTNKNAPARRQRLPDHIGRARRAEIWNIWRWWDCSRPFVGKYRTPEFVNDVWFEYCLARICRGSSEFWFCIGFAFGDHSDGVLHW